MTVIHLNVRVPKAASRSGASSWKGQRNTPSSGARALALAHYIDDILESGQVASAAAVAMHLGLTRARVSQIMALLGLSARIQEQVLTGDEVMSGRRLRALTGCPAWAIQWEHHMEVSGRQES